MQVASHEEAYILISLTGKWGQQAELKKNKTR